jgi:hypothetical protein
VLENNMAQQLAAPKQEQALPVHGNIRGKDYYLQATFNF